MITEKYENFIWDFDGTLFDSYPHTAAALCKTLELSGRSADVADAEALLRITVGTAIRHYGMSEDEVKTMYVFENQDDFKPITKIYPGCKAALERIHARGGKHFLFTHRNGKAIEILKNEGVLHLFTHIVTADDGFKPKPAPDAIEHIISVNGLDKAKTVMVGDREIDIGSGINAGIHTLFFDEFGKQPQTAAEEIFTHYGDIG